MNNIIENEDKINKIPPRVLVIKHGAFGDLIQIDGALRDIREAFSGSKITLLTAPAFRKLMQRCPHIDQVCIDERAPIWRVSRWWMQLYPLRQAQFDWVIDLQQSRRSHRYRRWLFPTTKWVGKLASEPEDTASIDGFPAQLNSGGIKAKHSLYPDVGWMANPVDHLLESLPDPDRYIVLIPGCSARHPQKRWPYYAELAQRLQQAGWTAVTVPGPDELELARRLPAQMITGDGDFVDWFDLAGILQRARFVVGNDTGPSHLAACLNTPGLALFGAHTSVVKTGIRRNRFDALAAADLSQLSAAEVFAEVMQRLETSTSPHLQTGKD